MSLADVKYLPETPAHDPEIEAINDEAFGPGRFVLAAY
ncbi:MAG: GNAT family N-acetyltransferase, partial [Mesorhizobium sp.]